MEWDNKVKMIQLGNQRHNSEEAKKEFQEFVLKNIDSFDGQAWDMFCNLVDLIVDEMKKDLDFWKKVYVKIKDVDCNDEKFGLRSGMRIAMIQTICENENELSPFLNEAETPALNNGAVSSSFSFQYFKDGIEKLMMLDNLDKETKDEYINDWYILFKEQKHKTVKDFVEWQFPLTEVNEITHDFWKCS